MVKDFELKIIDENNHYYGIIKSETLPNVGDEIFYKNGYDEYNFQIIRRRFICYNTDHFNSHEIICKLTN